MEKERTSDLEVLPFWKGACEALISELNVRGGFLVVPSAPSLCQAAEESVLWNAHLKADYAIMDSGFLALLFRIQGIKPPPRISGHQFIERLFLHAEDMTPSLKSRGFLWVVPDVAEKERICAFLQRSEWDITRQTFYVPPFYGKDEEFHDAVLLEAASSRDVDWVVLCIGGGRQEKLGGFLRESLGRAKVIVATGAAIAFFTGGQAPIPRWADRLYLGWLVRSLHAPGRFFPRYFSAFRLLWLLPCLLRNAPRNA